jgi:hypothetical protein
MRCSSPRLRTLCRHGFNQKLASAALGIHPHTLAYRVAQIRKRHGIDLDDADTRLRVHLAVLIAAPDVLHRLLETRARSVLEWSPFHEGAAMPMPLEGLRCDRLDDLAAGARRERDAGRPRRRGDQAREQGRRRPGPWDRHDRGTKSDRPGFYFEANNRNKQSLTVDLKQPEAREIVYRLAAVSDVFVQNFRKGVADRLGLGAAELRGRNPRLIYANATGYGPEGPESGDPSFDQLGLARSGIMFAAGEPDMPPQPIGGGIADQMGAVLLAYGVLAAVIARERYGMGQVVDASHLGSMSFLQGSR